MKNKIYPCLWFDGNAKAAADFYCSVFNDSKITTENPMVVVFELNGRKFMGLNGGPMFKINPSVSFFVICNSIDEIDRMWNQLSDGGMTMMAINKYPWSERYGWCQDKFGVNWQLMIRDIGDDKVIPSLMFTMEKSGKAEQAINFYTTVFKGSEIRMISRYEKGEHDVEGYIKHAQFTLENQLYTAMDSSGPHPFTFNEAVSFVVDCTTQEEIDYYWEKLTEGGEESRCGWLKDRFGVSWQIVPDIIGSLLSNPAKAPAVMQEVMKMKKIIIADLVKAADH